VAIVLLIGEHFLLFLGCLPIRLSGFEIQCAKHLALQALQAHPTLWYSLT